MTEKIKTLRERVVDAARRWYRGGDNAEAELAGIVQELEAELTRQPSPSCEGAP